MNSQHGALKQNRRKFLTISIIFIAVVAVGLVWYFLATPFSEKQQQINQQDTKATQLYQDHEKCVKKLSQDYTKLDSKNQATYKKAYDACEAIRQEQNKAVDEYKRLTQS